MEDISVDELTQQMVDTIRDAASKMTGPERRALGQKFVGTIFAEISDLRKRFSDGRDTRLLRD